MNSSTLRQFQAVLRQTLNDLKPDDDKMDTEWTKRVRSIEVELRGLDEERARTLGEAEGVEPAVWLERTAASIRAHIGQLQLWLLYHQPDGPRVVRDQVSRAVRSLVDAHLARVDARDNTWGAPRMLSPEADAMLNELLRRTQTAETLLKNHGSLDGRVFSRLADEVQMAQEIVWKWDEYTELE